MPVNAIIRDPRNFTGAGVSLSGEQAIGPLSYDDVKYVLLNVNGTIYNFFGPLPNKQFVISGIIAVGNKNIGGSPAEAVVDIFEADSSSGDTSNDAYRTLNKFAVTTLQPIPMLPLRILVNEGVWVNATMDNDDVHLTIFGYYIKKVS